MVQGNPLGRTPGLVNPLDTLFLPKCCISNIAWKPLTEVDTRKISNSADKEQIITRWWVCSRTRPAIGSSKMYNLGIYVRCRNWRSQHSSWMILRSCIFNYCECCWNIPKKWIVSISFTRFRSILTPGIRECPCRANHMEKITSYPATLSPKMSRTGFSRILINSEQISQSTEKWLWFIIKSHEWLPEFQEIEIWSWIVWPRFIGSWIQNIRQSEVGSCFG